MFTPKRRFAHITAVPIFWLCITSGAHAKDLTSYLQPAAESCEQKVNFGLENELVRFMRQVSIMQIADAEASLPLNLEPIEDLLREFTLRINHYLSLAGLNLTNTLNLVRMQKVLLQARDRLGRYPVILTKPEQVASLQGLHSNLMGKAYETIVANRVIELRPSIGQTIRQRFSDLAFTEAERDKEIDLIVRWPDLSESWVEAKFFQSASLSKYGVENLTMTRLLQQIGKMVRIKQQIHSTVRIYLVTNEELNWAVQNELADLDVVWIHFAVPKLVHARP